MVAHPSRWREAESNVTSGGALSFGDDEAPPNGGGGGGSSPVQGE